MHYLLMYQLSDDYLERRGEFRNEHLKLGWDAVQRGELVIAGAMSDPADMSALFFSCENTEPIEAFVQADPYYKNGLVKSYSIRQWNTAIGATAFTPLKPQ